MNPATCRRSDLRGGPARWAYVPLEHRETALVVHEVTDRVVEGAMSRWFGLPKTYHGNNSRRGHWDWSTTCTALSTDGGLESRKGGTGVPFLGCAGESGMLSHLGGTDRGAVVRVEPEMNSVYLPKRAETMLLRWARGRCFGGDCVCKT